MGLPDALFDITAWAPALEKYGAVVQLSVALYGADEQIVCGPVPMTPIVAVLQEHGYDPGAFAQCARECLAQPVDNRPSVVVTTSSGLAVVGVSLLLDRHIVGALVAGYALVTFPESVAIARLARDSGTPFPELWGLARRWQPIPTRRLVLYGELLQVLGATLLRENALRQKSEEKLTQLTTAAVANEEFLAVLSHELRTPLTPILAWTAILKAETNPKVVQGAEVIKRNALLQLRLVEDLLELTRAARGQLVLDLNVICLNDQVRSAREAVAETALKKGITVALIDVLERLWTNADGDRLQQIVRNVLLNAVKFTPAGGAVTITLTREGGYGVVHVRDTGEGIAPDFLPFVFDMFKQQDQGTRRMHAGLGIGLALVQQLTAAHGGTVSVASEGVGCGTQVTLRLPLAAAPLEIPEPLQAQAADLVLDGLRILVVEDMEDSGEAMGMMLERFGANVRTARDGIEALERVAGDDFDLVLCDLRMPRMDGFEFLRKLQGLEGSRTRPPVIAVSGFASSTDHLATQAAGFAGHIDKPFDDARLIAAVAVAMARRSGP